MLEKPPADSAGSIDERDAPSPRPPLDTDVSRQTDADVNEQIVALACIGVEDIFQRRRIAGRRRLGFRFRQLETLGGQTERARYDLERHTKVDRHDSRLD